MPGKSLSLPAMFLPRCKRLKARPIAQLRYLQIHCEKRHQLRNAPSTRYATRQVYSCLGVFLRLSRRCVEVRTCEQTLRVNLLERRRSSVHMNRIVGGYEGLHRYTKTIILESASRLIGETFVPHSISRPSMAINDG